MTATASLNTANAGKAIDADVNTFWQADRSMASGQWFAVDLGASRAIKGITFTVPYPAYPWWPPKYDVQVSANGTAWTNAATNLTGAATSTATFTATGRHVRIVCKGSNGNWWGISALTVQ